MMPKLPDPPMHPWGDRRRVSSQSLRSPQDTFTIYNHIVPLSPWVGNN